jgi:hypothetical protein
MTAAPPLAAGYIPDHAEQLVRAMPTAMQAQTRVSRLLQGLGAGIQELEDVAFSVLDGMTLHAAQGVHLRRWADLVGQPYDGLTDVQLRRFVQARLRVLRLYRHGLENPIDALIDIARDVTLANSARYFGLYPAGLNISVFRSSWMSTEEANATVRLLGDAIPAGVGWCFTEALPGYAGSGTTWGTTILSRRLYP